MTCACLPQYLRARFGCQQFLVIRSGSGNEIPKDPGIGGAHFRLSIILWILAALYRIGSGRRVRRKGNADLKTLALAEMRGLRSPSTKPAGRTRKFPRACWEASWQASTCLLRRVGQLTQRCVWLLLSLGRGQAHVRHSVHSGLDDGTKLRQTVQIRPGLLSDEL